MHQIVPEALSTRLSVTTNYWLGMRTTAILAQFLRNMNDESFQINGLQYMETFKNVKGKIFAFSPFEQHLSGRNDIFTIIFVCFDWQI